MHRDAILIFLGLVLAIVAGALLMNYAKGPSDLPQEPAAAGFSVITDGNYATAVEKRVNYRIKTEDEFASLWNFLHADDQIPVPTVDFEAHDVLAVFDGLHPTGGYDISVVAVEPIDGVLKVTILHEEPGTSCITTEVVTSPFELVVIPKSEAPIERIDLTEINECE